MAKRNWFWDGLGKLRGLSRFSPNGNGTALARGRTRRATSQRKRSLVIEPLECRQLLSVAPTAPDTSGLDACFLADLAIRTPHPQLSSDQPSDSARLISLSNYTASEIIDPGIPEIEPFIQAERYIDSSILNNAQARPSYWGETATAGDNLYRLHLCDNGMALQLWTIDWGDGSTPQQITDQSLVVHQYSGGANQYSISVTAWSYDGTFVAGVGDTPGGAG